MKNNNTGNPVPLLDNKEIEYIITLIKRDTSFGVNQSYQTRYKNNLIEKLQNGVETFNGSPNKN